VIKRYFPVIVASAFIFSCNNAEKENNPKVETHVVEDDTREESKPGKSGDIVYLDTAESIHNVLAQDWVLKDDMEALEGMEESSQFEISYRSFYFSTRGTFVKNPRNTFDYGSWIYDDAAKTISISNTIDRNRDVYKIARITATELILVNVGINSTTNLIFGAPGMRYRNPADEPYALENNRWRIKPRTKESDSAIHQRLKDNLRFFILFYKSAMAKNDKVVSFWGLPSCFKWYGGAIYLKKKTELKENWLDCFYNEEQAMQAYALAERLLSQKYTWPKGESNWLKLNLAVVEMMYARLDQVR